MSDVDLLKQAATKLREAAEAAVHDDFEDIGWAAAARNWLGGPVGDFCALMSPEVAVALAGVLEATIENLEQFAHIAGGMRDGDWTSTDMAALEAARAVLGDSPEKPAHSCSWVEPTFPGFPRFCMCGAREGEAW
jgi:hypothetical protein